MLERHEGRKTRLYKCPAGKWTIGVGHNVEDNGLPKFIIDDLFDYDIDVTVGELKSRYKWFHKLDQARRDAVTDMCFQLGITRFSKFKLFIASMDEGDYGQARMEMFDSKWYREDKVTERVEELANMILTGEYRE